MSTDDHSQVIGVIGMRHIQGWSKRWKITPGSVYDMKSVADENVYFMCMYVYKILFCSRDSFTTAEYEILSKSWFLFYNKNNLCLLELELSSLIWLPLITLYINMK